MPTVDLVVESDVSNSIRARQVSSMFDLSPQEKCRVEWHVDVPIDANDWNVGLIVGPSGSGKSTVMRHLFGEPRALEWSGKSVVDDIGPGRSVEDISHVCQAVGFNTIPAWLRPFPVLSNGEKFRVELARRLLEDADPIVVDEFTSVVDRQVAQIGSHAVQKYIRKNSRRFVAVTCHYDVQEWLQPDWVLDMATCQFQRRLLQRRPTVECVIGRVHRSAWRMFAPFHYMSADLHPAAKCFGLWANSRLAAFTATMHMPHPKTDNIERISRTVTLPDWQGLGLNMALVDELGAAFRGVGKRLRHYPSHPALCRTLDRSPKWRLIKRPGEMSSVNSRTGQSSTGKMGGRPCAVFEYVGPATPRADAQRLLAAP